MIRHLTARSNPALSVAGALMISLALAGIAQAQQWTTNGIFNSNSGHVGVGTTTPAAKLHVVRSTANSVAISGRGPAGEDVFNQVCIEGVQCTYWGIDATTNNTILGRSVTKNDIVVTPNGNVGIGTTTPAARLDVAGDVVVSGNISARYQDIAEWVPSSESLSSGSVVALIPGQSNSVVRSTTAYDTRVAGVVSSNPGIDLGEGGEGKIRVATTGRVKVRVDASSTPIEVGDLLVTSSKEGTAMKSEPVRFGGIEIHRPGTLIGKALEPLPEGEGEILVLLSLQ